MCPQQQETRHIKSQETRKAQNRLLKIRLNNIRIQMLMWRIGKAEKETKFWTKFKKIKVGNKV